MKLIAVIVTTVFALNQVGADEICGRMKIQGGPFCDSLSVSFDLSGCTGAPETAKAEIKCNGDEAVAYYESDGNTYSGQIKKSGDIWIVASRVSQSRGIKKIPVVEAKPVEKEISKSLAKPEAKSQVDNSKGAVIVTHTYGGNQKSTKTKASGKIRHDAEIPTPIEQKQIVQTSSAMPEVAVTTPPPLQVQKIEEPQWYQKLKLSGNMQTRTEGHDNYDFNSQSKDRADLTSSRFRIDFLFQPQTDLEVFMQPQYTKIWGKNEIVPSGTTTSGSNTLVTGSSVQASGGTQDTAMIMHQAYLKYHLIEPLELIVGRQELSYGDQLVIGAVDWHMTGRAFDAVKLRYVYTLGSTDFFTSKITENNSATYGGEDKDFHGAYNSMDLGSYLKNFDLYVLNQEDLTASTSNQNLWLYGVRLKSKIGLTDYRIEADLEDRAGTSESQFDGELGYTFVPSLATRVSGEYFQSSSGYNQLFPTGHKWLGYADLYKRQNIKGYRLGLKSDLLKKLSGTLDFHSFQRTDNAISAYSFGGSAIGSTGNSVDIAQEWDLVLKYKLSSLLNVESGGSLVTPGSYSKEQSGYSSDNAYFYYLQLVANW